jgi:pimeloyl-ACP methyl ester carboxylesterase
MLHRNVVIAHGTADVWADADESVLLASVLPEAVRLEVAGAGHGLEEASDARIGEIAAALASRIEPRELPPVLVAIEEMGGG